MNSFKNMHDWKKNMDHFFGDNFWNQFEGILNPNLPQVNLFRKEYEILCVINVPGLKKIDDISCEIHDQRLLIKGEIKIEPHDFQLVQEEIMQGAFKREIELPFPVRKDKKQARYKNGLVWIQLYKLVSNNEDSKSISIDYEE
ncbi:Hsp20/alpha crystallin family protein [Halalkalibacillus sediminis]|uniref:Hsp20/alpha crystallin family protein n=1 Tax=Halalkalibacillus sediminis TaxID=2018042 RepID=A0A2I0QQS9_9BACI|nr:Hsp20/alpha crystallin family protein [Halalkalibacillus sediminis]PKR76679.1 Hsp20/alpha crystallin family protein [Halalkalibacillus sediminis]